MKRCDKYINDISYEVFVMLTDQGAWIMYIVNELDQLMHTLSG